MAKQLQRSKGSGSVYYMGNRRRNPWRTVKTAGWEPHPESEKLVQKRITIGYFPTRDKALEALINYNDNPYDIKTNTITFSETYEKWSKEYFPSLSSKSSIRTVECAYKYCTSLHKMRMKDIRVEHLEGVIHNADVGSATKGRMKSLFNMMYRYALRHEIVEKDYADLCNPVKQDAPQKEVIPFTDEEVTLLWSNLNEVPFVDMILIGIYSEWRPQELAILKTADIDLEEKTMRGGLKTDAGKNRVVPIHPLIYPLIEKRYDETEEYLFNDINSTQGVGKRLSYTLATTATGTDPGANIISSIGCYLLSTAILG